MTSEPAIQDLVESAITALAGQRWAIVDAPNHVPPKPGLYAIYGDAIAWCDLELTPAVDGPLYVGKAEESFVARDLQDHFAACANAKPQTGSSTVRRSFAALLRETLSLTAVPRNLENPGHFSNYGLADGGDARLNEWTHARLSLAVWPTPPGIRVPLADLETQVIRHFTPSLNISKNPAKLVRLSSARKLMAAEAASLKADHVGGRF